MIGFEKYLVEQGFSVKIKTFKSGKWVFVEGYSTPSTMTNTDNYYLKDGIIICIGLHERDRPVTLISPRPKNIYSDDSMNRLLSKCKYNDLLISITEP